MEPIYWMCKGTGAGAAGGPGEAPRRRTPASEGAAGPRRQGQRRAAEEVRVTTTRTAHARLTDVRARACVFCVCTVRACARVRVCACMCLCCSVFAGSGRMLASRSWVRRVHVCLWGRGGEGRGGPAAGRCSKCRSCATRAGRTRASGARRLTPQRVDTLQPRIDCVAGTTSLCATALGWHAKGTAAGANNSSTHLPTHATLRNSCAVLALALEPPPRACTWLPCASRTGAAPA